MRVVDLLNALQQHAGNEEIQATIYTGGSVGLSRVSDGVSIYGFSAIDRSPPRPSVAEYEAIADQLEAARARIVALEQPAAPVPGGPNG